MSTDPGTKQPVDRDALDEKARKKIRVPMDHQAPAERITNFAEVMHGYTREQAMEEAQRCVKCKKRQCCEDCPIGQDVIGYVTAIMEGDFDTALSVIMEKNPFPASMGRVCPQYCQARCARAKKGDAIQIASLKRAAADFGEMKVPTAEPTGKRVAIVGAGPAGLGAGYYLALRGHAVTVFDREKVDGGMLSTHIPPYRLPRDQIEKDIARIKQAGVEIRLGVTVGKDLTVDDLLKEHDAVLITVGTHLSKFMRIPGEENEGVVHVIDFLRDYHLGRDPWIGDRVAVIGGGSSAMDAVRTARRLGKEAWLVYRRAREQMPAQLDEIVDGEEEEIVFHYLTNPIRILGEGKVTGIECVKMELGEPDESGRARPVPVEGSEFVIEVDMVIEAVSQQPDLADVVGDSAEYRVTRWNTLEVDEAGMTSRKGVFAGGDAVNGPSTIVEALKSVYVAVEGIHEYLVG